MAGARRLDVKREVDGADVYAERRAQRLYAEAKGQTAAADLNAYTLYGQLPRRMNDAASATLYAVVVIPTAAVEAAVRVPGLIRQRLRIDVFEVGNQDHIYAHA